MASTGTRGRRSGSDRFLPPDPRVESPYRFTPQLALMADVQFMEATRIYAGTDVPAVDALDLEVADGEFLVMVGPSGSGKTTALRMLAGLEEVDGGSIFIGGRDVTDLPPKARDVAMVFQSYALYPYLTVAANIAFPLRVARVPRSERDRRRVTRSRLIVCR